ncbi:MULTISPECIES: Holliday junction branch migration protein RuvA [unclassified Sporolactobacillus]|uniref:Holliday junction branch migration protein RuvA n=1 Tax=unclassified Sporolactobacillus TaxID=2628533 RepID=UPI002368CD69|nr:Holliday junction branch migration protein RuvA [Sporolactobacillus sp. CQH2019]MDD9147679.1 Holliday junction branch migration protein RuvA [Sporolactobacillus sp. CQH2019]
MFDYIRGLLTYLSGNGIVLEQGGIGYRIVCANPFSYQPLLNHEATLYLFQYLREDANVLYGFKTREERELFVRLLTVSGIGPKSALAILASDHPERIIQAIEAEDEHYLTRFPGVGRKTAGQIVLDLKGKLNDFAVQDGSADEEESSSENGNHPLTEALDALKTLGYSDKEIGRLIPILKKQDLSAENYLKEALRLMMKA